MKSHWKTQKGDEWRYESGNVRAAADLNSDENIFSIKSISCSGGSPTERQIMRLLQDAKLQLSEVRLLINLSSSESTVGSSFNSLREKGFVNYQSLTSEAKVELTYIKAKKLWSLW